MSARYRSSITCLALLLSIYFTFSALTGFKVRGLPYLPINLGVDLKGGSFLVLEADLKSYFNDYFSSMTEEIADLIDNKLKKHQISFSEKGIYIKVTDNQNISEITDVLHKNFSELDIVHDQELITLSLKKSEKKRMRDMALQDSMAGVRKRIDGLGTKEISMRLRADGKMTIQIPRDANPEKIKSVLSRSAKMSIRLATPASMSFLPFSIFGPGGFERMKDSRGIEYFVAKKIEINGDLLRRAMPSRNHDGNPAVAFTFNDKGAKKFAALTKRSVGKMLAIVMDGEVITAPVVNTPILSGSGEITGSFTWEEASELALVLRSGALPAPIKIVEERNIGPSLGEDSIKAGKKSLISAFIVVSLCMIIVYGRFGICSTIALACCSIFTCAAIVITGISLTFPGIAGIVLTMGMAVDGNILTFERIIDEEKEGASQKMARIQGFESSAATIFDSNLTTMIAAAALFFVGSGPIRGFAVTLFLGVITTMFSTVIVSRVIMEFVPGSIVSFPFMRIAFRRKVKRDSC